MLGGIVAVLLATAAADDAAVAREHFDAAERSYRVGDFGKAIGEYKEAYRLNQQPALLFNLGQAQRQSGNHKEAAFYFGQYFTQVPDAANRPQAEALLREEREFANAPLLPATPEQKIARERERQVRVPVAVAVVADRPWRPTRVAAVATGAAAVIALGAGIVEGARSKSLSNDLQARVRQNGGALRQQDLATVDSAHGATQAANVLFVVSAALAAAGVGLWFAF